MAKFDYYDDFEDGSYTGWTESGGSNYNIAESGGLLNITATGTTGNTYMTYQDLGTGDSDDWTIHIIAHSSNEAGDTQVGPLFYDNDSYWYAMTSGF